MGTFHVSSKFPEAGLLIRKPETLGIPAMVGRSQDLSWGRAYTGVD